ncbi:MAG: urease accessory protein UreD [Cyanobacteria bacterium P01_F01_bin.53]
MPLTAVVDVVEKTQIEHSADAEKTAPQHQLALKLGCDEAKRTTLQRRYMAYPLSVSPIFRLEENGSAASSTKSASSTTSVERAYLYRMNTSPGLLAGDRIGMSLQLADNAQLYLADQSATKVHAMPQVDTQATVNYDIRVGDRATLEFLPEPLILFADATLTQTTEITLHPTAGLSLGEIILPGRLARGEVYEFRKYFSRIRVKSPEGPVWFTEAMKLQGKENSFVKSELFASGLVMGTLILVLPESVATSDALNRLSAGIESFAAALGPVNGSANGSSHGQVDLASSILPGGRGLFVRAIASATRDIQSCFREAVNSVRTVRQQVTLPYSL